MAQRHSEYVRAAADFYSEPPWVVHALLDFLGPIPGGLHDPCCGTGTVIDAALGRGVGATGADVADRAGGRFPVRDFRDDQGIYANIVTNPSSANATWIIEHGLGHVLEGGRVAVLVPLGFLASIGRFPLFARAEFDSFLVLSRRPSIPPGELLLAHGEKVRGKGSVDFGWAVFRRGRGRWWPRLGHAPP
jgi:hypothetical protein